VARPPAKKLICGQGTAPGGMAASDADKVTGERNQTRLRVTQQAREDARLWAESRTRYSYPDTTGVGQGVLLEREGAGCELRAHVKSRQQQQQLTTSTLALARRP
jgi:hypothetical protein